MSEVRELTSEKNKAWRGYVCKVSTLGMTAEMSLNADQFKHVGAGQHLKFTGHFEDRGGYLKLIADAVVPYLAGKAGAA